MLACFQVHLVGVRGVASEDDWWLNNKNNPTYLDGGESGVIDQAAADVNVILAD